eukprot:CAMPEP_0116878720 /NCGR_PEP_ID=MMETSP0463-20121206/10465_1 /TAXON_ID=181622 /ORGANISM="Strombidinopsis sp, Strain SopsisLIS2011" /LENGTH=139 /DNA_ID=CAMNT_0004527213 /DNA_START=497 /DNA_END=916 /DNA_ORIENTATION=+
MSFAKFATRIGYLNDEFATIIFSKGIPDQVDEDNYGNVDKEKAFSLQMRSDHMVSQVTNKPYQGTYNIPEDADANVIHKIQSKDTYEATLKKEAFVKFFQVLKMQGQAVIGINDQAKLQMEYTIERCPYVSVHLETAPR